LALLYVFMHGGITFKKPARERAGSSGRAATASAMRIASLLSAVSPAEGANYFVNAGYASK
jgi:hypothetical protein